MQLAARTVEFKWAAGVNFATDGVESPHNTRIVVAITMTHGFIGIRMVMALFNFTPSILTLQKHLSCSA